MTRPFYLTVDSASEDEPDTRTFGSLDKAIAALNELDPQFLPACVYSDREQRTDERERGEHHQSNDQHHMAIHLPTLSACSLTHSSKVARSCSM